MSDLLSIAALQAKADALAAEINAVDPYLSVVYSIHNTGQLRTSLQMIEDTLLDHPAGHTAMTIFQRNFPPIEPSAFHGIAACTMTNWLGFSNTIVSLAIISINIDQYDNYFDALADLYRQTWHAIEVSDLCQDPALLERLAGRLLVPKRSAVADARANLRSDIFACLMLRTEGYQDAIDQLSHKRAFQAISRESHDRPERFPFTLSVGATAYAAEQILDHLDADRARIEKCRDITEELAHVTTDDQIRQWWRFCEAAQDMAWRGYRPEIILAAGLNHSDDPYVRSIVHQIEALSRIPAADQKQLDRTFNPFMDIHRNEQLHHRMIDETFGTVIAQLADNDRSDILLETAARQNQDLLQGRFLGWCASALQGAAQAYDQAGLSGRTPIQAAQMQFQMMRADPAIDGLYQLTREVISRRKIGEIILLDQLPEIAKELPDLDALTRSVEQSRTYLKRQEMDAAIHANDLDMFLMPTTPTLKNAFAQNMAPSQEAGPATPAPAPTAPHIGMGLGLGGTGTSHLSARIQATETPLSFADLTKNMSQKPDPSKDPARLTTNFDDADEHRDPGAS